MFKKIALLILAFLSLNASAQLTQKFDQLSHAYHKNGLFEGTILIADSSGIVYHQGFGMANRQVGRKNDTTTIFRLGSLEKQFTAMLTLQLVEQGKLNMQGKISAYLPEYRKDIGDQVTIEQLLTHTSGIPNYTALPNVWDDSLKQAYNPVYLLRNFGSGDLEFTPGSKYKYTNTNYLILAMIIQEVTGKSLHEVLRKKILRPAGMRHSDLVDHQTYNRKEAVGYYRLGAEYRKEPDIHVPNALGAASLQSTAYDLYLWDRALYTDNLLSAPRMKDYTRMHFPIAPGYGYGYGWEFTETPVATGDTIRTMEHSGAIRAFRAIIFRVPAEKKAVILLSNAANQSAYDLFADIMQVFRGVTPVAPGKLLADTLFNVMRSASIDKAVQVYKDLKAGQFNAYRYNTPALEFLGERLMEFGHYTWAAAVYQLAVAEDPAYNGYYNIGKAYEKSGKIQEAIAAYQQAVKMNSKSRAGIDAAFQLSYLMKDR